MPRNSAGNYTLPLPPVVSGNTIVASFENTTDSDIATELTNSLDRNGRGGMLASFKIADGTESAPGMAFTQDPDNGFYRIGTDNWAAAVGGAKALEFGPASVTVPAGVTLNTSGAINSNGSTGPVGQVAADAAKLKVSSASATDAAIMAFNRLGTYAAYFGIDTDNQWKVGGWSLGTAAYTLLHEGNSFSLAGGKLTTTRVILSNDVITSRGSSAGALFLGDQSAGARYLHYDGSEYFMPGARLRIQAALTVSSGGGASGQYEFQVHVGANQNPTLTSINGIPTLASINDTNNNWGNIGFHGTSVLASYDNAVYLGFTGYRWIAVFAVNGVIQTSDAREKRNIEPTALGLDFIESLNPVSYQRIVGKNDVSRVPDHEEEVPEHTDIDGNVIPATTRTIYKDVVTPVPGVRTHYGLIAQDVQRAVLDSGVADFGGYIPAEADAPDGLQGLCYTEFIAPLIKAVQELSTKVRALEAKP